MKYILRLFIIFTAVVALAFAPNADAMGVNGTNITKQDVVAAQKEWGKGIVEISKVYANDGDFRARASELVDTLYAYGETPVMFKPTLASEDEFRETFDQALSYFIGTEGTEDQGFAIKGWTKVRFENNGIYTDSDSAIAMGNYFFKGSDSNETKADYTFGFIVDDQGNLKINLHHSSLPYSAQ